MKTLTSLVYEHYPTDYWRIHRRASIHDTHTNLKSYAKEVKVQCFNYMTKSELVVAINLKVSGGTADQIEAVARERFAASQLSEVLK